MKQASFSLGSENDEIAEKSILEIGKKRFSKFFVLYHRPSISWISEVFGLSMSISQTFNIWSLNGQPITAIFFTSRPLWRITSIEVDEKEKWVLECFFRIKATLVGWFTKFLNTKLAKNSLKFLHFQTKGKCSYHRIKNYD